LEWSGFTADRLQKFVEQDAGPRKGFGPHGTATSVRSFLRFLVSQGFIAPGLELAIPQIRHWLQAALPQRLTELELERLCVAASDGTAIGRRNYAIIQLLAKLGLRANEVARLRLEDVDWSNGFLLIRAPKSHRERSLPLRQEVGEVLVSYLKFGRPGTTYREVFLRHAPSVCPLKTPSAITKIVKRLLVKAGIERRSSGAHLLRHTAATRMVNQGATFKDVADVLGHQSLQTTAIYAKLDLARLAEVALPWPGGER
jgi:site-specific recombinase XerD